MICRLLLDPLECRINLSGVQAGIHMSDLMSAGVIVEMH